MVNTNGSPVTGSVNLKVELAYSGPPITVKCSQDFTGVPLTNGVFHLKVDFDCTPNSLTDVLAAIPNGQAASIRVTDVSHSKVYSYQALHAVPFSNISDYAKQLVVQGTGANQVLVWNNTDKKWEAGTVAGASGGTVTNVSVSAPLAISNPATTPSITLPQATGAQSGYLSSADWTTFNNKEGTIAGGTAAQYYRGDKSWQTLDTSAVAENIANLYFTNARALGVPLTGFVVGANSSLVATDTVLSAFEKTQGQINTLSSDSTHFLKKDNTDSITGTVNVGVTGSLTITNAPALPTDAANRQYVNTYADTKLALTGGTLSGALTLDSDLKIKGGSNYVTVRGHGTSAAYNFILPQTAGTSGYVLQTDGSGNLSWANPSSTVMGTGTVNSGSITDGSIVDADVNASAAIAQSKIANLTTDLAAKVSTTLSSGNILVGNASNVATGVAVSGDATLSNAGVLTLANTAVTAGTYKSVTVDAKGRVTAGTNPTTLAGYGITDTLVTGVSVTAPITNTGTVTVPLIGMPAATGAADGYLTSANFNTFNNKQASITSASALNTGSLTTNLQGGLVLNPYNTAAGNTGEIRFNELAANGSSYTGFKAPDVLAGNVVYTLPSADGSSGQALTTNSTGGLSWTTVATSSSNLTGDIGGTIGANTIGAGKVTLTHLSATGTKDNTTYLRGDNTFANLATDVRAVALTGLSTATNAVITATDSVLSSLGKLQKQISDFAVSAVGGDLSGNLPNPTVAKIQGKAVASTAPLAGQVLKYNTGTPAWEPSYVLVGDLKSSALGNLFPGTGCAANQTLYYSVVGDAFTCANIDSLDASKITTGTIAAARLPSSATYWSAATGGINYASGNVGIGTTSPGALLQLGQSALTGSPGATPIESNRLRIATQTHTGGSFDIFERDTTTQANLDFRYGASNLLTIQGGGNVGIGTSVPGTALDVNGAITKNGVVSKTTSYSVPTATNVTINLPHGGTTLTDGYVYKFNLATQATATVTGATYLVYQTAVGTWASKIVSSNGSASNNPSLQLSGTSVQIFHNHASTYSIGVLSEAILTGNVTVMSPHYFGLDGAMTNIAGNVGIGTAAPAAPLHIYSTIWNSLIFERNSAANSNIQYKNTVGSMYAGLSPAANFGVGSATDLTTAFFTVTSSGNVGIGTTNPISTLEISNNGTHAISVKDNNSLVTEDIFQTYIQGVDSANTTNWYVGEGSSGKLVGLMASNPNYRLFLGTNGVERFSITDAGNVGIGTTAPTQKLSIQGTSVSGGTEQTNISAFTGNGINIAGSISNAAQDAITYASGGGGGAAIAFRRGGSYDTYLDFYTNSAATAGAITQAMTINNSGLVGIGTTSPIAKLEVNGAISTKGGEIIMQRPTGGGGWARGLHYTPDGSTNATAQGLAGIGLYGTNTTQNAIYLTFGPAPWTSTTGIQILANGNVGLGTASPSYKLDVQGGGVNATGGFTSVSDIRLKTNIEYLKSDEALKKINSLNGIYYDWKDQEKLGSDHQIGLIAQQVQKVFPEAIKTNKDGFLSVAYSNLISPVIESIKALYLKVTGIEAKQSIQARQIASLNAQKADNERVKALESENSKLKQENAAIKAYLCKKDPSATICK